MSARWVVTELSLRHQGELDQAVDRALTQWQVEGGAEPLTVVRSLERVLLFLKQHGNASAQARQVTSLAFAFGAQAVRSGRWQWASVSEDGSTNPSLVSSEGARACLVIDVVTQMVLKQTATSLTALYQQLLAGAPHEVLLELSGVDAVMK